MTAQVATHGGMIADEIHPENVAIAHEDDPQGTRSAQLINRRQQGSHTAPDMGMRSSEVGQQLCERRIHRNNVRPRQLFYDGQETFSEFDLHG